MGQAAVAQKPNRLSAVLGSCVGVVLYHPRLHIGALSHVVLPDSNGRSGTAAKFADSAIPHMLTLLEKHGAFPSGMVAKIVGGSCMFGNGGPLQIGEANIKATTHALGSRRHQNRRTRPGRKQRTENPLRSRHRTGHRGIRRPAAA